MRWSALSIVVVAACLASSAHALYFHINEGEVKCFLEEVPESTVILTKYRTQVYKDGKYGDPLAGSGILVKVTDPEGELIVNKVYNAEGRFTFTSHEPGEHKICLQSNSSTWFGGKSMRVHILIEIGEHANNYEEIAKSDQMSHLDVRVRQLLDQVQQIAREQSYQRQRELHFREVSETTNSRVLWWSVAQTLVLVAMGFWQLRHLKTFFRAKKLV